MNEQHEHVYVTGRCACGEWLIPRCPLGCGLARHKNSCEAAAEAIGMARAALAVARASEGQGRKSVTRSAR